MIEHMFDPQTLSRNTAAGDGDGPGLEPVRWDGTWQASLFGHDPPTVDATLAGLARHQLDETSWIEYLPRWLGGADDVFAALVARTPSRPRPAGLYDPAGVQPGAR